MWWRREDSVVVPFFGQNVVSNLDFLGFNFTFFRSRGKNKTKRRLVDNLTHQASRQWRGAPLYLTEIISTITQPAVPQQQRAI